ncbi:MAG TPA: GNAT family protein [Gaiellaceae bacterium]
MIPLPDPPLLGEGFVLRGWTDADQAAYRDAMRDPENIRRLNDYSDETAADIEALRVSGTMLVLAIADARSDAFLGFVALIPKEWRSAELAYMVVPAARGRGLAHRAIRLLGDWAFRELSLGRLQLRIAPDNEPSIRVARRCGYTFEGVMRSSFELRGRRLDSGLWSLLPTDPRPE